MDQFINQAPTLVKAALKLAKLQKEKDEERILSKAAARLVETGYDNWDGGITFFSAILEIPLKLFSEIEPNREQFEKALVKRFATLTRLDGSNQISEVIITPVLSDIDSEQEDEEDIEEDPIPSFWEPGYFRLFISHSSVVKETAFKLKEALAKLNIAGFVAHEDIEPAHEWQLEIEGALRTQDALLALLSPDFSTSSWCDQEVGFALGKGKFVLPLSTGGVTPYGFMGKIQGMKGKGLTFTAVAEKILDILLKNEKSSPRMTEVLVERFANSGSFASARSNMSLLEKVPTVSTAQAARIRSALKENRQVRDSIGVPARVKTFLERIKK